MSAYLPILVPKVLTAIARTMAVFGTLGVAALVLLIDYDIIGRQVFNQPIVGVAELAALGIVVVVFLQAPYALAQDRMIRTDMLINMLKRKSARLGMAFEAVLALAGAAIFGIVVFACFPEFLKHLSNGDAYGDPAVFLLPKWPTTLVVTIGSFAMAVIYLFQAYGWLRRALTSEDAA